MGGFRTIVVLVLAAWWLGGGPALADGRVVLIIGNSTYKNVPRLLNPVNDAALVAAMFNKAGFDHVVVELDLNITQMRKALREFGDRARDADMAVIYYAGHGIELDGNNYLIPIDAVLETDTDVLDEALPLERVLLTVEPARQLRLIILDACRDNPFAKTMRRTIASRGIGRGLAKVEPNSPNTMIAFAAKAGSTASDGDSRNSPFAAALVQHLPKPGLDLRKAFGYVRDDVLKATGFRQEPFVYGSLGGADVALVPASPVAAAPQPSRQDVRKDYEFAERLGTRTVWKSFLAQYPDGFYADLAREQLNRIAAEEARADAERARLAALAEARLAAEAAKRAEQAKTEAAAIAAEDARIAAEKAKQIESEKAAAAEQARLALARAAAEKLAADKAEADKKAAAAAEKAAAEFAARQVSEKQSARTAGDDKNADAKVALAVPPPAQTKPAPLPAELARSVQAELHRVGCMTAAADGEWNSASQQALALFNKYAGTKLDLKLASVDALDAIKARSSRVCPVVCNHGFRADGDSCVRIACRVGYRLNDANECEKVPEKKPIATRQEASPARDAERKQIESAPSPPQASGQVLCNQQGCRRVRTGCRVGALGDPSASNANRIRGDVEVCN
jgi:uncharacterized caspase-like protein